MSLRSLILSNSDLASLLKNAPKNIQITIVQILTAAEQFKLFSQEPSYAQYNNKLTYWNMFKHDYSAYFEYGGNIPEMFLPYSEIKQILSNVTSVEFLSLFDCYCLRILSRHFYIPAIDKICAVRRSHQIYDLNKEYGLIIKNYLSKTFLSSCIDLKDMYCRADVYLIDNKLLKYITYTCKTDDFQLIHSSTYGIVELYEYFVYLNKRMTIEIIGSVFTPNYILIYKYEDKRCIIIIANDCISQVQNKLVTHDIGIQMIKNFINTV